MMDRCKNYQKQEINGREMKRRKRKLKRITLFGCLEKLHEI